MSPKQKAILEYLEQHQGPCSPTEIGIHVGGKCYAQASSWACSGLAPLVLSGRVRKNPNGHYLFIDRNSGG